MAMTRQEANRKIVKAISQQIESYSDLRFHQVLQNLNIVKLGEDQYYEEPEETLKRIPLKV